jgi:hypothetical protein
VVRGCLENRERGERKSEIFFEHLSSMKLTQDLENLYSNIRMLLLALLATASYWFIAWLILRSEDEGEVFLRNVG